MKYAASKTRFYPPEFTATNGVSSAVFSGPEAEAEAKGYAEAKNAATAPADKK